MAKTELTDTELMRYARQIILPKWDVAAQLRLANSCVVMVGMGGLGCPITQTLARAGVGYLRLVDFDVVDASNLQRQNLFTTADIGKNKAEVGKAALTKHNELIELEAVAEKVTQNNAAKLIAGADLVVDGTDNFTVRDILNTACFGAKTPLLSAAAIAQTGQLALYDFRNVSQPCYRCVFGDALAENQRCAEIGVLATTTQIIGNMAAHVALAFLGLQKNLLPHKLMVWDGTAFTSRAFTYKKDAHCRLCADV